MPRPNSKSYCVTLYMSALLALVVSFLFITAASTRVDAGNGPTDTLNPLAPAATFPADAPSLGPIPDSDVTSPTCQNASTTFRDVTFTVTGLTGNVQSVIVSFAAGHTYLQDLEVTLSAPTAESRLLFAATGTTSTVAGTCAGSSNDLSTANTYTFADTAAANWWTTAATNPVPTSTNRTVVSGIGGVTNPPPVTSLNLAFAGVAPNGTWKLRFRDRGAGDTGPVTAASLTITPTAPFTDDPLSAGASIKGVHINELRTRVNTARTTRGMGAASFTDSPLGSAPVKAVHITELRVALDAIYTNDGKAHSAYTDPGLSAGTLVKAQHITDLRNFLAGIGG